MSSFSLKLHFERLTNYISVPRKPILARKQIRNITDAGIEEAVGHICVCRTHARKYTHTYNEKRMDGRAGVARVLRSLVLRSSNEESSRVPARRSARSVNTRLAIEQYRERAGERCATKTGSFFFPHLFSRAPRERETITVRRIDDDWRRSPGALRRRRETCKRTVLRSWSFEFSPRYCSRYVH